MAEDLAFWEALAARGAPGDAALEAYASKRPTDATRRVVARYRNGDGFTLERALATNRATSTFDDRLALVERAREDMRRYFGLMKHKWLAIVRDCDIAPRLPDAFGYVWDDDDALDMRAFLAAKLVRWHPWAYGATPAQAARLRDDATMIDEGSRLLAQLARTPSLGGTSTLPQRWKEEQIHGGGEVFRYFQADDRCTIEFDEHFVENVVRRFIESPGGRYSMLGSRKFWFFDAGERLFERLELPWRVHPPARWPTPRSKPTVCLWAEPVRRLGLYGRDDDMDGCLPAHLLGRLLDAGRASATTPNAWWSRTRFDREVRGCKAGKDERKALQEVWYQIDKARREGMKPDAFERLLVAMSDWAREALAVVPAPRLSPECTPEALATWLGKRAYDALPTKDTLTNLEGWVHADELENTIARCNLTGSEGSHLRLTWTDLDAAVRSGVSLAARTQAVKDVLHAYRYDRAPWSAAQRKAAREIAAQSMQAV